MSVLIYPPFLTHGSSYGSALVVCVVVELPLVFLKDYPYYYQLVT